MQRFAQAVAQCPGDWLTWLYLARLREMPGGEFLAHLGPDPLDRPDRRCLCGRSRGAGARCCPSAPGPGRVARANGRIAFVRHQQLCACLRIAAGADVGAAWRRRHSAAFAGQPGLRAAQASAARCNCNETKAHACPKEGDRLIGAERAVSALRHARWAIATQPLAGVGWRAHR